MFASSKRRLFCDSVIFLVTVRRISCGLRTWSLSVEAQCRVPGEVYSNLQKSNGLLVFSPPWNSNFKFVPHMPGILTSMGNLPPIHTSWAAYKVILWMPETWASRELTALVRIVSIDSRSFLNISGCWSYFVEMYCFIAADIETALVLRNGRKRIFLVFDLVRI